MSNFGSRATSTNFKQIGAGGQTVNGISSSTSFILKSGFLYFGEFNPKSRHWRWYDDETSETHSTARRGKYRASGYGTEI